MKSCEGKQEKMSEKWKWKITDKTRERLNFWHVAICDTPRTAGELGGDRWEASQSWSPCLSVCLSFRWLQVEHSLPLLLSK